MQQLSRYNHRINFFCSSKHSEPLCLGAAFEKKTASEGKNALQKILQAFRALKYSSTEMMKPKFSRLNSKTEPKPEKLWVEKGRGFAGAFSQCC